MKPAVAEKDLSEIWRWQRFSGHLLTDSRERVKVLYPGRLNDDRGGDFRDAVIAFPGRIVQGEVELHVASGDWRAHGHDRDPSYNGVVLHVVYARNTDRPTVLQSGVHVPVLALERNVKRRAVKTAGSPHTHAMPCFGVGTSSMAQEVASVLDSAGRDRFRRRVASFAGELRAAEPGEVLYRRVMEALGYSRNRAPFLALAQRVPLAALEALEGSAGEFRRRVEDQLLSAAGFSAPNGLAPLHWQLFRARPGNSPPTRIKAISHMLARYRGQGLLHGLLDSVRNSSEPRGHREIEEALMVARQEQDGVGRPFAALGRERAADIAINVLLPFAKAFGGMHGDHLLEGMAVLQYAGWPGHAANCVVRHMLQQTGLTFREADSAQRQQGLMEIYAGMCTQGRCAECALGKFQSGHDVQVKSGPRAAKVAEVPG